MAELEPGTFCAGLLQGGPGDGRVLRMHADEQPPPRVDSIIWDNGVEIFEGGVYELAFHDVDVTEAAPRFVSAQYVWIRAGR